MVEVLVDRHKHACTRTYILTHKFPCTHVRAAGEGDGKGPGEGVAGAGGATEQADEPREAEDEDEDEGDDTQGEDQDDAYRAAREVIESELGSALRQRDLDDQVAGSSLVDEERLLQQCGYL